MTVDVDEVLQYFADEHRLDLRWVDADTPLFTSSRVDSFSMIDVMTFVEEKAGKRCPPADFIHEKMDTARLIAAYINAA